MPFTVGQIKTHLTGMGHSGTLNKVRNQAELFERSISRFLLKCHPLETIRVRALTDTIHDDLNDYTLPVDFLALIDLIPQANRSSWDRAVRDNAGMFDLQKAIRNRVVSIEGSEGSKIIRINWQSRSPKVLHSMESLTDNGTWAAVAGASGLVRDTIIYRKGGASIRFDVASTGDGISNSGMSAIDLTDEDEVADVLFDLYIKNDTDRGNLTSIQTRWGNDLTTNYWTGVSQTLQADASALQVGWNEIRIPWSTATETGTVAPATVDSFRATFTLAAAINDLRVDNIRFSIGRNFDLKYYSKFLIRNVASTLVSLTTSDSDTVLVDNDTLPLFLMELLIDMAHQMEGSDSTFDISFAEKQLSILYPAYKGINPSQVQKVAGRYGSSPARGRW